MSIHFNKSNLLLQEPKFELNSTLEIGLLLCDSLEGCETYGRMSITPVVVHILIMQI